MQIIVTAVGVVHSAKKKMVAVLLPSVVALHSSVEHAVKAIYEQISVTIYTL